MTIATEENAQGAGFTVRLGLFFDGTGNNQSNSELGKERRASQSHLDGTDDSYGNDTSNVAHLHALYPDDARVVLDANAEHAHLKVYLEGIGTRTGQGDALYSQATGRWGTGVLARVEQMPARVLAQLYVLHDHNPGLVISRIEIDLFGFSRGAAAARHCANDLLQGPDSSLARAIPPGTSGFAQGFAWRHPTDLALNFIGLFDTVAGIVAPLQGDFSANNALNPGLNLRLAPGIARQVVHLVAEHEYRHNFALTRTDDDLMMPGSHSDIGGGYLPLATERVLLSKPDNSLSPLQVPNEHSEAHRRTRECLDRELDRWQPYFPGNGLSVFAWDVQTHARTRDTQPEKRVYAAVAGQRQVRGELSRVYLQIMHQLAARAGVAFAPDDDRMALPVELHPIAAKLRAYALGEPFERLNAQEHSLLQRHYIHFSANWNALNGWKTSDLDTLFINRPGEDNQRTLHPNE